jgi:voltage-gated potassium channel
VPPPRRLIWVLLLAIVAISLASAILVRLLASEPDFPTFGIAVWWAIQTVTTVGYGDVTPTTSTGRTVAGILMVAGYAVLSLITAAIAATFVDRLQARRAVKEGDPLHEALERIDQRLEALEKR